MATVGLVAAVVLATPAAAEEPPGFDDPGDGEWVAFTIEDGGSQTLTTDRGSSTWGPVTVERHTSPGLDVATAFASWNDAPPGGDPEGWPSTWSVGDVELERVESCDYLASSCSYVVKSGGTFEVHGGGPPEPPDAFPGPQSVELVPALPAAIDIKVGQDLQPVKGVDGQPGSITLDAGATTDGSADPDSLTYEWVVSSESGEVASATGRVVTVALADDGVYDITLTVTNPSDGHSDVYEASIAVSGVAPDPEPEPDPEPGPAPSPDPSSPKVPARRPVRAQPSVAAAAVPAFFTPERVPTALNGGRTNESQVIWLWRPDWFDDAPAVPGEVRTASPPRGKGRQPIVVSAGGSTPDSSAGPWLAALGAFGLLGLGVLVTRRRKVRAEL